MQHPKNSLCLLAAVAAAVSVLPKSQAIGYIEFNGHGYALTSTASSVGAARAEALALGGDLVSINSPAEESFLESTFGGTPEAFWIGLFAENNVWGNWAWYNGDPASYFHWHSGEPSNSSSSGSENNVILAFLDTQSPGWADVFDNPGRNHRGIIEVPIPEAPSMALLLGISFAGIALVTRNGATQRR